MDWFHIETGNVHDEPGIFWQTTNQGEGLSQKNWRANLKMLQISKDWTICASVKITAAIDWIILNKFKFISSWWFLKTNTIWIIGYHWGKLVNQLIPIKTAKQERRNKPLSFLFYIIYIATYSKVDKEKFLCISANNEEVITLEYHHLQLMN